MNILLSVHPIMQFLATLLALHVFLQGIRRFRSLHLGQQVVFKWKHHVVLGEIALGMWLAGMVGGTMTVYLFWGEFFITGMHGKVALAMTPFIMFGLASGLHMHYRKHTRKVLPVMHGLSNVVALVLACVQAVTGYGVYQTYVAGL